MNRIKHKIRHLLVDHFDIGELKALAFDLDIDFENISGQNKNERIIELILYCERNQCLQELLSLCREIRPKVIWPDISKLQNAHFPAVLSQENDSNYVLIVEDDPDWQFHLKKVLLDNDYNCVVASTYKEAAEFIGSVPPLTVVLDLCLDKDEINETDWGGWDVARKARGNNVSMIIVTAFPDLENIKKAFVDYNINPDNFFDKSKFRASKSQFIRRVNDAAF
ncbi:MAG: response regulator [Chloroflexi bacterium]|nr:response regulator [Chloroflexota bacterium]